MSFLYAQKSFEMIISKLEIGCCGFLRKNGLGIYICILYTYEPILYTEWTDIYGLTHHTHTHTHICTEFTDILS